MIGISANPLPRWQRRVVVLAAWALLLTGLAWLPLHYLWGTGAGKLPHPLEPWLLRLHGLAAPVGLFALGLLSSAHVPRGWRSGRQRASGLSLCLLIGALAASGYALSYLAPEPWHAALGWAHAGLGMGAFLLGSLHSLGRKSLAVRSAGGDTSRRAAARPQGLD